MQGIVYTLFSDMVIEHKGIAAWNAVLDQVKPASMGCYTTGAVYDDGELFALIGAFAQHDQRTVAEVVQQFGRFLFPHLMHALPTELQQTEGLFPFLISVGHTIHREVVRLTPSAQPPEIFAEQIDATHLRLSYRSKRGLCQLCDGLLHGAAAHFGHPITSQQSLCVHRGDTYCQFEIKLDDV